MQDQSILEKTQSWLEKIVIGLNLCPFAKNVYVKKQIRYHISHANTLEALEAALKIELDTLTDADPNEIDTTILIHPNVLNDFFEYNDFLERADQIIKEKKLLGEIQIASFHPHYQFAGTKPDDIENYTNRSPFPILHLLRESRIEQAVKAFRDASQIFSKNIETLRRVGMKGWDELYIDEK